MLRFLPVLIPLLLVLCVVLYVRNARKKNQLEGAAESPHWETQLWAWGFVISVIVFMIALIAMLFDTSQNNKGEYIPAYMENGEVVQGRVLRPEKPLTP